MRQVDRAKGRGRIFVTDCEFYLRAGAGSPLGAEVEAGGGGSMVADAESVTRRLMSLTRSNQLLPVACAAMRLRCCRWRGCCCARLAALRRSRGVDHLSHCFSGDLANMIASLLFGDELTEKKAEEEKQALAGGFRV